MARNTDRYNDLTIDDIVISSGITLPDDLEKVVSKVPKGARAKGEYLKRLVDNGTLTTDDVIFLLESGALQD